MKAKNRFEILLVISLLTHLQGFFGNLYEEILTPNSIVASVEQINAYNRYFSITEPYYYYVPLTQIGVLMVFYLAFFSKLSGDLQKILRFAALISSATVVLSVFIITQYNLKMFFGDVNHLEESIHRLYLEWAILNGARVLLSGATIFYLFKAYRIFLSSEFSNQ